ncbi:craniofacial development protein 1 [Cephus cinctus]|uniref:Craniofacial development protein 1 n=1 Tax=Cephus cinctus TaxID=211228 RepID=A0AAJ7CGH9_CEPCN|nr:craniofacial development protein 1 [Cephus cinctus]
MSREHELPSDSDEDDEDYIPDKAENDPVSEVDSEDDAESGAENENDENQEGGKIKKKKRGAVSKGKGRNRKRKLEESSTKGKEKEIDEVPVEKKQLSEEEERKKADSLWADFMKDAAFTPKPKLQNSTNCSRDKSPPVIKPKVEEKVKITKVFEFAGEEVKVEKEVSIDSAEARLCASSTESSIKESIPSLAHTGRPSWGRVSARSGLGGISSVLGQLGKKAKISTLEKSKLDWDNFKKQENLEEEITSHNRGKDGYLERQDFLQRADLRQFEIEKQLRNTGRRSAR